jgi:hypothetical protein
MSTKLEPINDVYCYYIHDLIHETSLYQPMPMFLVTGSYNYKLSGENMKFFVTIFHFTLPVLIHMCY